MNLGLTDFIGLSEEETVEKYVPAAQTSSGDAGGRTVPYLPL